MQLSYSLDKNAGGPGNMVCVYGNVASSEGHLPSDGLSRHRRSAMMTSMRAGTKASPQTVPPASGTETLVKG